MSASRWDRDPTPSTTDGTLQLIRELHRLTVMVTINNVAVLLLVAAFIAHMVST